MGILFKGVSIFLTGNLALGLQDEEKRKLGAAFKRGVVRLPTGSVVVKSIDFVAPWADLLDGLVDAIHVRIMMVLQARNQFIQAQMQMRRKAEERSGLLDEEA